MSKRSRAPRRRIERIATQVVQNSMPTAGKNIVIHNAEDTKTLVRTLLDLTFRYQVSNVNDRFDTVDLVLHIRPANKEVAIANLNASSDRVVPIQEIARWTVSVICLKGSLSGTTSTETQVYNDKAVVFADISAMRKMKETDNLVLGVIASTNDNEVKMDGHIYAWFKE